MIRVRATKDGTYGGYVWLGPIESDQGNIPGEVFDVDEKPFPLKDEYGNVVHEMEPTGQVDAQGMATYRKAVVMVNGKIKLDKDGHPVYRVKMTSFFTPEWMVRVADDTPLTYPEREVPFRILPAYKAKKDVVSPPLQKTVEDESVI